MAKHIVIFSFYDHAAYDDVSTDPELIIERSRNQHHIDTHFRHI